MMHKLSTKAIPKIKLQTIIGVVVISKFLVVLNLVGWSAERPQFVGKIHYEYFEGKWSELPDFDKLGAVKTGEIDKFDLTMVNRDKNFAIRFTGFLEVPVEGKYLFIIKSGGIFRLYVSKELVLKRESTEGKRVRQMGGLFALKAGKHPVILTYLPLDTRKVLEVVCEGPELYRVNRKHWLYIGWQNDHPKSWNFMGGSLTPGRKRNIQYTVKVDGKTYYPDEFAADRRSKIKWYLAEGYLPSPISEWNASSMTVKIQHVANRILDNRATAVYTRISLTNNENSVKNVRLNINAGPEREICLNNKPITANNFFSTYKTTVPAGKTVSLDFVALANGTASVSELRSAGGFENNYNNMASYYNSRISQLTRPITLPNAKLVELYKAAQIVMWESVVRVENGDLEMRGSGGNPAGYYQYDRTFSHDVPNMVAQFIREGDFDLAKGIMESEYYQRLGRELEQDYLDAIPKYIIPYALYLQFTGDVKYFTESVRENIKTAAHSIHEYRDFKEERGHYGIMRKSNTLDNNSDYLIVDNFAALHGLTAYEYICEYFKDTAEASWAENEMNDLNKCLNDALDYSMKRRQVDWYMSTFDDDSYFWNHGYDGNWLGTSLMMSTFPWNASLKGFNLGGTWKEAFDRTIENAIHLRNISPYNIPERSWGAWWGHEYGACYNAGMGLQLLYSDKH
ncbi:MAG: PA14 domain-containing protein, partial [bacterium]